MKRWSKIEDEYLIKNYNSKSFNEINDYLNDRTPDAIRYRAKALNLTVKKQDSWTSEEIDLILSDLSDLMVSKKIDRTVSAIRKKRLLEKHKLIGNVDYEKYFDLSSIEDGVPVININSKSSQYFALLNVLKIGQSFEYPNDEKELVRNQIQIIPFKKFKTKKWTENTRRVWLIEILMQNKK